MSETVGSILIAEDERAQREAIQEYLVRRGYVVEATATGEDAVDRIGRRSFSVLITDLRLSGIDGLEVIRRARELDEEMGLLLVTAYASLESAVEALRLGAHDYLLKPLILEEVERKVRHLISHRDLIRENIRLRRALQQGDEPAEIVADSPVMREVLAWVKRAASSQATVLITGETGTGKEVVARAIHNLGARRDEPFCAVNVAALPEPMVESGLFGHERGAFTGAEQRRDGVLRAAANGSVFLDEIGELPRAVQAKLLRALEAHEVQPLGSDRTAPFNARILAATNRDIEALVREGRFREDLYYRLNVVGIRVPSLGERPEDVPALIHQLVRRHARRSGMTIPVVSAEAIRALCSHKWRGNVRELSNVLERALILADAGRIDLTELPADVHGVLPGSPPGAEERLDLSAAVDRFERNHIAMVLKLCEGNRERAARELGLSPATLYRKLDRLGLKGQRQEP